MPYLYVGDSWGHCTDGCQADPPDTYGRQLGGSICIQQIMSLLSMLEQQQEGIVEGYNKQGLCG